MENTNLYLEQKTIDISTRETACEILNSDVSYKSICRYHTPNLFNRDDSVEFVQWYISSAVIPCSFYTINDYNNKLDVIENSIQTSYYFTKGNYNVVDFINEFKSKLGSRWGISMNTLTNVLTITNSTYIFTILGTSTISAIMGFSNSVASTSASAPYSVVMPRCVNFLSLSRISVRCPELGNNTILSSNNQSSDIILTIPNNSRPNGVILYDNTGVEKNILNVSTINSFTILLTDDDGREINFNGIPSYFTLNFDIYRRLQIKAPSFHQTLREHYISRKNDSEELNLLNMYPRQTLDFF